MHLCKIRPPFARLSVILWGAVALGVATGADAGREPPQVSVASSDRLVFQVDVGDYEVRPSKRVQRATAVNAPGFITTGAAGEPVVLSRQFLVGLPAKGTHSVSWRVLESASLGTMLLEPNPFPEIVRDDELGYITHERYEIDEARYQAAERPPVVAAGEPGYVRAQRVLPVVVSPVMYDPITRLASIARRIEIEVRFTGGGDAAAARAGLPTERPMWEGLFERALVNPDQARAWRSPRRPRQAPPIAPRAIAGVDPLVKLRVRETGFHRVSAADLNASGFPSGVQIDDLHLFRRGYDPATRLGTVTDIPFDVDEDPAGTGGIFDANDALVFYGLRLRDDPAQEDSIEKFSDHNVYWLGATGGTRMAQKSLSAATVGDTANASFPAAEHFEVDRVFRQETPPPRPDFYQYNRGNEQSAVSLPFRIGALKPGTALRLRAEFHGFVDNFTRDLRVQVRNNKGTFVLNDDFTIVDKQLRFYDTQDAGTAPDVPASNLAVGLNYFEFDRPPGANRAGVHALLNWLEVSYESLYRARGDALAFNSGDLIGTADITVTGLSDTDVWLFDVTDPDNVSRCVVTPAMFTDVGGSYAMSFTDDFPSRKSYVVTPVSAMTPIAAADVIRDEPSQLIGNPAEGGVDVLVISHGMFVQTMAPWVTYRKAQGYRVLIADVEDIYDEFGGGVPGTRGIHRMIEHFYELGGAGAVAIIGDGNEDNKGVEDASPPSFVPSESRAEHVGAGFNLDEIVTLDKEFVKLPTPNQSPDPFPDMVIGRIPVGSLTELQIVLQKTFRYEQPQPDDFWRRRIIIAADDAWSAGGSVFGGDALCYFGSEQGFEFGQEQSALKIESSLPVGWDVRRFYLSEYTDQFYPNRFQCQVRFRVEEFVRDNATGPFLDLLNQGATLVTIQAHMNRSLVAHTKLFTTVPAVGGSLPGQDHLRLDNRNKPFIIFGMGCHFSDYSVARELNDQSSNSPNGDAFAEQLLFLNTKGAVGTYGSSGYEYLSQTNNYMNLMTCIWFYEDPYADKIDETQAHWVFGELMTLVELEATRPSFGQTGPVERYHLLGDPLLRIEGGPPLIETTVDGQPIQSGDLLRSGGRGDSVQVEVVVSDENAIDDVRVLIDNVDVTNDPGVSITARVDTQLVRSRSYGVTFAHQIQPGSYDIVVRALQAPDTNGTPQMAAEFVMKVFSDVKMFVNGRPTTSGATVSSNAKFRFDLTLPVSIGPADLGATLDSVAVTDFTASPVTPEDSTAWTVRFERTLSDGPHRVVLMAAGSEFTFDVVVSSQPGLTNVVNVPNPFGDHTNFVFRNDADISAGRIDIYTTSGRKVRSLVIPPVARTAGENAVFWDGRDAAGDEIANGVYIYLIHVEQRGRKTTVEGKLAKIK